MILRYNLRLGSKAPKVLIFDGLERATAVPRAPRCRLCLRETASVTFKGMAICPWCLQRSGFGACSRCTGIFKNDTLKVIPELNAVYCEKCHDEICAICKRCEEKFYRLKESHEYCSLCASCMGLTEPCQRYNYVPQKTIFFDLDKNRDIIQYLAPLQGKPAKKLFFGLEIEVQSFKHPNAEVVKNFGGPMELYYKHDGTIRGTTDREHGGFEMVYHPFSWEFWQGKVSQELKGMMQTCLTMGCSAYDAAAEASCGIHIHQSKSAFSNLHLFKLLSFIYKNPGFILQVSQRKKSELDRFARLYTNENLETLAKTKAQRLDKYSAVNLRHPGSVEIRVFKGTLRHSTICAYMEFSHLLYLYTKEAALDKISPDAFLEFSAKRNNEYPFFTQYWERIKDKKPNQKELIFDDPQIARPTRGREVVADRAPRINEVAAPRRFTRMAIDGMVNAATEFRPVMANGDPRRIQPDQIREVDDRTLWEAMTQANGDVNR